jgi:hypothetical protein
VGGGEGRSVRDRKGFGIRFGFGFGFGKMERRVVLLGWGLLSRLARVSSCSAASRIA